MQIMIFTNKRKTLKNLRTFTFFFFFLNNQIQGVEVGEGKGFEVSEIFSLRSEVSGDVTYNTD